MNVKRILTALEREGLSGTFRPSEDLVAVEDEIRVTEWVHIRVGADYAYVVRETEDGVYAYGKERSQPAAVALDALAAVGVAR